MEEKSRLRSWDPTSPKYTSPSKLKRKARCRGYLLRRDLKRVQGEYEDIVREVEGGVEHLSWRGHFIPQPHFTDADTDSAFFIHRRPKTRTQECPEGVEEVKEQDETPRLRTEFLVPEKDEEPRCGPDRDCRGTSTAPGGDTELEGVRRDGVAETAALTLQMSGGVLQYGEAPPIRTLLKDVTHTPEALKQHRNTLAMELLWIQQAIASRKKYLTLKQKMETS